MSTKDNPYPEWPGFTSPAYTPIPDELLDLWLPHLSGAELKVLLYICRRTFGWKKDADAISLAQIARGIRRRDGSVLDYGTGLTVGTACHAVKSLEAKGLITASRQTDPSGGDAPTVYTPRMREPVYENRRPPSTKRAVPRLRELQTQETPVQNTMQEEDTPPAPSSQITPATRRALAGLPWVVVPD